jgi:hypothetical protein
LVNERGGTEYAEGAALINLFCGLRVAILKYRVPQDIVGRSSRLTTAAHDTIEPRGRRGAETTIIAGGADTDTVRRCIIGIALDKRQGVLSPI